MNDRSGLESQIQGWLEEIKPVPARNPQAASRSRAQFLGQAVSVSEFPRHKGWRSIFRKERLAMNMLVSILVIAGLLFGGGATVNAAQNDLPNEPLYGLKLWSEDFSLQFQNNPEQKVERLLDLTQARIQEMARLADTNQAVPDQVRQRLQDHIQQALQICATLDDAVMDRTLLQVHDRLQQQDREMEQVQIHATQIQQPILLQTRTMLHQRLQVVDEGLLNHEMFRNAVHNGFRFGQVETATPPPQNELQNGQPTLVPVGPSTNPGRLNPNPTGSSYGPGEPNPNPGRPNPDAGGPNISATPSATTGGSGMGGNGSGSSGSGGNGTGGNGTGGNGSGGSGTGDNGNGGNGTGGGGGGSGFGGPGGKP